MKNTFAIVVLLVIVAGCSKKTDTTERISTTTSSINATAIPVSTTRNQAVAIVSELPEVVAWSNHIEHVTEGKTRAAIIATEEPKTINGNQYWSVDFYESQPTHLHRWESFLVSRNSKEIMVDDINDGVIGLQTWRKEKEPMARIQVTNAPLVSERRVQ